MLSICRKSFDHLPLTKCKIDDEVGRYYSIGDHRKYIKVTDPHFDGRGLKIYSPPSDQNYLNWDLDLGFESWKRRAPLNPSLEFDPILEWLAMERFQYALPEAVFNSEIVCCADTLINLALTPYEKEKRWKMMLIRHNDVIFLNEYQDELEERLDKRDYYRERKFLHYLTRDKFDKIPDPSKPLQASTGALFRGQIAEHKLFYSANTDCYDPVKDDHVLLKTQENYSNYEAVKWWIEAKLTKAETVACGYKDDCGVVTKMKEMDLEEISVKLMKSNYWKVTVCMNFLDELLSYVKNMITEDNVDKVYLMQWQPGQAQVCLRLLPSFKGANFLPAVNGIKCYINKLEGIKLEDCTGVGCRAWQCTYKRKFEVDVIHHCIYSTDNFTNSNCEYQKKACEKNNGIFECYECFSSTDGCNKMFLHPPPFSIFNKERIP